MAGQCERTRVFVATERGALGGRFVALLIPSPTMAPLSPGLSSPVQIARQFGRPPGPPTQPGLFPFSLAPDGAARNAADDPSSLGEDSMAGSERDFSQIPCACREPSSYCEVALADIYAIANHLAPQEDNPTSWPGWASFEPVVHPRQAVGNIPKTLTLPCANAVFTDNCSNR